MAVVKRVLCRERLRRVPPQFSWVDHRLVRDRHISRCSAEALALYLFLVTVGDAEGLSYYSDESITRRLPLDAAALSRARQELMAAQLIAYQRPLYQVLALGECSPGTRPRRTAAEPLALGRVLSAMTRRDES
jgi:hypothetical protein